MNDQYLGKARLDSSGRIEEFRTYLQQSAPEIDGKACVYATGSYGRLEAGPRSDLDVFIVVDEIMDKGTLKHVLNGIDEIKLKAKLINLTEHFRIPKFDGSGRFMSGHSINSLVTHLGSSEDDYRNILTARMLLLLESRPLEGLLVYNKVLDLVIDRYFADFKGHEDSFRPTFFINDISRMWRTFCVNYESKRKNSDSSRQKIKNLKLKFSRMLTCYSAIIYMHAIYARNGSVSPNEAQQMVRISPTERIESLPILCQTSSRSDRILEICQSCTGLYSSFLELVHKSDRAAAKQYKANEVMWQEKSYQFGQLLADLIDEIGSISPAGRKMSRLILI